MAKFPHKGIPRIKKALKDNGSPEPFFDFDDDRTFFEVDFYIHPAFNEGTDLTEIKSKNQSKETVNNFKLNESSEKLIITLFQLSDSMEHMWRQFDKLKNREGGTI